ETTANLTDRTPFLADPLEDLPHHPGLFGQDLITRRATALMLAHITVAVGRTAENVDRAVAGSVLLTTAAPLHNLGALVFGDHALGLQQQVLLGSVAEGVAQEDHLDAAIGEFLEDQNLIGIFARKPIGIENVEAVNGPGSGLIPESFQARTGQGISAVAVVHEAQFGLAFHGVIGHALRERLQLAGDGVLLLLLVAGNPGIDPHSKIVIGHGWSSSLDL